MQTRAAVISDRKDWNWLGLPLRTDLFECRAQQGGEMKKVYLAIAILIASGWLSEAVAEHTVPINNGGVLQRECGKPPYEGCVWCSPTTCYFVHHCSATQCTYTTEPLGTKGGPRGPVNASPINTGKPIAAAPPNSNPPPTKGGKPIGAAPIVTGHPVQASPGTGTKTTGSSEPVLERGGGGGKH